MSRGERHQTLLRLLRDGQRHTGADLARAAGVSTRTIYRDMEALMAAGVPVAGTPGAGYQATGATTLPPLSLSPEEVNALTLGLAIVAEAADPALAQAAAELAEKVDSALPASGLPVAEAWKIALSPLADTARGVSHMPTLRRAIEARQKLRLQLADLASAQVVRPLRLENFGPAWTLLGWNENAGDFVEYRLDLITQAEALPELFMDDPGTTLADYQIK